MRLLVEILHPAHVHVFRNAIQEWRARGDEVLVLSREKECANELLEKFDIPYISISRLGQRKTSLLIEMLVRDGRMWSAALRFKPDVLVGIMGVTIAQVGKLIKKPAIVFYDTENAKLTNRFVYPLAHSVCTPDCYQGKVNGHHVTYPSYHELAYLHPNRFMPDVKKIRSAGLDPDRPYFILRFVSWQASHDIGEIGLNLEFKQELVRLLAEHGRVLISSESPLPLEFEPYRFSLPIEIMHHAIAHAAMLIGESATMASEAAVLGVPAFFISDTGRGYTDEEEKDYQLVYNYTTQETAQAMSKLRELLRESDLKSLFQSRRQKLLQDKIDTTTWMINYVDQVVDSLEL
ncbi:MAG: DUF354 domain-containing protein [Pirellulales bacterium]